MRHVPPRSQPRHPGCSGEAKGAEGEGEEGGGDDGFEDLETGEVFSRDGAVVGVKGSKADGDSPPGGDLTDADIEVTDPTDQGRKVKPHMRKNNEEFDSDDDDPDRTYAFPPPVDLDAYADACRLPPAEETEDEREARFQRERYYGL